MLHRLEAFNKKAIYAYTILMESEFLLFVLFAQDAGQKLKQKQICNQLPRLEN